MVQFKTPIKILLYFALLCWLVVPVQAQLTIFKESSAEGNKLKVEYKVNNFEDVSAFQFGMEYDASLLKVDSIKIGGVPDISKNTNFNEVTPGLFRFIWNTGNSHTLDDGTALMTAYFTILNSSILNTNVCFPEDSQQFFAEFVQPSGQMLNIEATPDCVTDLKPNSILYIDGEEVEITFGPNPIQNNSRLIISNLQSKEIKISIFSIVGGIIYQDSIVSSNNQTYINIPKDIFPNIGTYFLKTTIDNRWSNIQKIILL